MDYSAKRKELQKIMFYLGSLAGGLEEVVGPPAEGMAYVAGQNLGEKLSERVHQSSELLDAIMIAEEILNQKGFLWKFEKWKHVDKEHFEFDDGEGNKVVRLVFRDCMIRQCLYCYGHPQESSLCYMMYGVFSGLIQGIMGREAKLEIKHTGPNACLKELKIGGPI
jgi:predicted hydrocarbon binding protein